MAANGKSLADLRRELDEIDDAIHDLIIRRSQVVTEVGRAKEFAGGRGVLRPGREARILRRLVERHVGPFPVASLIRIWREMISASVNQQSPFSCAVVTPGEDPGYWALAREQFGTYAPLIACGAPREALEATASGRATVAVLPVPAEGQVDPWWTMLLEEGLTTLNIIWHLPFVGPATGRHAGLEAVVVAPDPQEESGEDRSLFVFETDPGAEAGAIAHALAASGLSPLRTIRRIETARGLVLVLLDGYIPADDVRLADAASASGQPVRRVRALGGYPVPLEIENEIRAEQKT